MTRVLPALLLIGCSVAADEVPTAEVAAAQRAWLAQGLPLTERCFAEQATLGKSVVSRDELEAFCHVDRIKLEGCYRMDVVGDGYAAARPIIFVGEPFDRPWLDLHELAHWLGDCSGLGVDGSHSNERIWGKRGAVELAARELEP